MFLSNNPSGSLQRFGCKFRGKPSLVDNCCLHLDDYVNFSRFGFACASGEDVRVLEVEVGSRGLHFDVIDL